MVSHLLMARAEGMLLATPFKTGIDIEQGSLLSDHQKRALPIPAAASVAEEDSAAPGGGNRKRSQARRTGSVAMRGSGAGPTRSSVVASTTSAAAATAKADSKINGGTEVAMAPGHKPTTEDIAAAVSNLMDSLSIASSTSMQSSTDPTQPVVATDAPKELNINNDHEAIARIRQKLVEAKDYLLPAITKSRGSGIVYEDPNQTTDATYELASSIESLVSTQQYLDAVDGSADKFAGISASSLELLKQSYNVSIGPNGQKLSSA
jgi:hypothetical protein